MGIHFAETAACAGNGRVLALTLKDPVCICRPCELLLSLDFVYYLSQFSRPGCRFQTDACFHPQFFEHRVNAKQHRDRSCVAGRPDDEKRLNPRTSLQLVCLSKIIALRPSPPLLALQSSPFKRPVPAFRVLCSRIQSCLGAANPLRGEELFWSSPTLPSPPPLGAMGLPRRFGLDGDTASTDWGGGDSVDPRQGCSCDPCEAPHSRSSLLPRPRAWLRRSLAASAVVALLVHAAAALSAQVSCWLRPASTLGPLRQLRAAGGDRLQ
ncbi:unnamed protein product, partial [Polarella glacialis]